MFKVYGDYGYTSEELIEEFDDLSEAKQWASRYIWNGDAGGYSIIEIARFADDGEYIVENVMYRKDH